MSKSRCVIGEQLLKQNRGTGQERRALNVVTVPGRQQEPCGEGLAKEAVSASRRSHLGCWTRVRWLGAEVQLNAGGARGEVCLILREAPWWPVRIVVAQCSLK